MEFENCGRLKANKYARDFRISKPYEACDPGPGAILGLASECLVQTPTGFNCSVYRENTILLVSKWQL